MKAFTRHRNSKPAVISEHQAQVTSEQSEAPIDANDDFIERLGDLDRFIGGASAPTVTWPSTPSSRNLFSRPPEPRPETHDVAEHRSSDHSDTSEADDFKERLGDLDRFIGGPATPAPAPLPAPPSASASDDNEANDFMERLGDLDRFIGGPVAPPRQR